MAASSKFEKVKNYYNNNLWDISRVKLAVGRWITEDEFEEITGEAYSE